MLVVYVGGVKSLFASYLLRGVSDPLSNPCSPDVVLRKYDLEFRACTLVVELGDWAGDNAQC